ncbi:MAG: CYTH domain-containing protein [candidate division Zixibacteria bacterium]|nr:CYTH domain-containing protein [candidate division Zixibacteria bacterium]
MVYSHKMNQEIEIKLNLGSFTNYLKLRGFIGQIEHEDRHLNAFLDTEDRKLADAGWALRVRAENQRGLVTIKSIATESAAAFIRQEMEAEIQRSEALEVFALRRDVMSFPVIPIEYLREKLGDLSLMMLVKFENLRQKKYFKIGDYTYTLEVDKTEFSDGSVDYELEVELPNTDRVETVQDALRKMFNSLSIPFERQSESKFARALHRAKIF